MNEIERKLLEEISSLHDVPQAGVYNIRRNGKLLARGVDSEVNIVSKKDKLAILKRNVIESEAQIVYCTHYDNFLKDYKTKLFF